MGSTSPFTEVLCPPADTKLHFCLGSRVPHPGAHTVKGILSPHDTDSSLHSAFCYFQIYSYKFPIICTFLVATRAPSCLLFAPTRAPSRFQPDATELSDLCSVPGQGPELCSSQNNSALPLHLLLSSQKFGLCSKLQGGISNYELSKSGYQKLLKNYCVLFLTQLQIFHQLPQGNSDPAAQLLQQRYLKF